MPDKDHVASREFVVEIGAECLGFGFGFAFAFAFALAIVRLPFVRRIPDHSYLR
jgi:hypothetical protein